MKRSLYNRVMAALIKYGYDPAETAFNDGRPVLVVDHDYTGPYPSFDALSAAGNLCLIGAKYGVSTETRGYYQRTYFIFNKGDK